MSWRLAGALEVLRDEVRARWPGTVVWTIGDANHAARASDHNPNPYGVVTAIDVVGRHQAEMLWSALRRAADPRIKYLIFNGQIVSSTVEPWRVRSYGGSNPHRDHIHVSVGRGRDGHSIEPELYDDRTPWGIGPDDVQEDDDMTDADRALLVQLDTRLERIERRIGSRADDRSTVLDDLGRLRRSVRVIAADLGLATRYDPPAEVDA